MKINDLKKGMILIDRNGRERYVIGDNKVYNTITNLSHTIKRYYNEDLKYYSDINNGSDIIKIEYGGKVIWERD